MSKVFAFMKDESGATAIEYGLLASLIAIAIISGSKLLGSSLNRTYANVAAQMK